MTIFYALHHSTVFSPLKQYFSGGGLGRTHRNESTFARLADPLGYVDKDDIFHVIKAIVATQRDYGRRDDRK